MEQTMNKAILEKMFLMCEALKDNGFRESVEYWHKSAETGESEYAFTLSRDWKATWHIHITFFNKEFLDTFPKNFLGFTNWKIHADDEYATCVFRRKD